MLAVMLLVGAGRENKEGCLAPKFARHRLKRHRL